MSWYVDEDGAQTWINRDSTVFTVVVSEKQLPLEQLSYLAVSSKKAVYQEAICEDDQAAGARSKRSKDKQAGKQRGFIIRAEVEESPLTRVVPWFKDAAKKLMDCSVVSRVDADEAANLKKAKKKEKDKVTDSTTVPKLGANECRIETTSRIHHFAHGPGYRVEVSEGMVAQRLNMFTSRKEIPLKDWLSFLLNALESTGTHVMILKRSGKEVLGGEVNGEEAEKKIQLKKDKAQEAENDWLQSLLTGQEAEDAADQTAPVALPTPPAVAPAPTVEVKVPVDLSRWDALAEKAPARRRDPPHRAQAHAEVWQPEVSRSKPPKEYAPKHEWQDYSATNGWNGWDWQEAQVPVAPAGPTRRWGKAKCVACARGGNLKLYWDDTEQGRYCRTCWVSWYGEEPPASCATR